MNEFASTKDSGILQNDYGDKSALSKALDKRRKKLENLTNKSDEEILEEDKQNG